MFYFLKPSNTPSSTPKSLPPLKARPLPYRRRICSAIKRIASNISGDISGGSKSSVTLTGRDHNGLTVPVYPLSTSSSTLDFDSDSFVIVPRHDAPAATNIIGNSVLLREYKVQDEPQFPQIVSFEMDIPTSMCPAAIYEAMVNHAYTYRSTPPCFPAYYSCPVDSAQNTYWHLITRDGSTMTLKWTNEFIEPNYRLEYQKEQLALRRLCGMRGVPQVIGRVEAPGGISVFTSSIGHISLRELVARVGTLDKRTTTMLMAQVFMTIHRMHAQGVIHFDINPDTIMINEVGRVTICEFTKSYVFPKGWDEEADSLSLLGSSNSEQRYLVPWPENYTNHRYSPQADSNSGEPTSFHVDVDAAACVWHEVRTAMLPQVLVTSTGRNDGFAFRNDILSADEHSFLSTLLNGPKRSLCLMDVMLHPVFDGVEWNGI